MTEEENLESTWSIYYDSGVNKGITKEDYEKMVTKPLGSFSTISDFWKYWNNIHLNNLPTNFNLRLFRNGIRPLWEDKENVNGGKWYLFWLNVLGCFKRQKI